MSHTIAKLEAEYGYFLFVRNRNNVELTTNGKLMMPYVRNLLACMESLDQEIANLGNISKGQVKVAAFNSATLSWIPEILKEFQKEYPGIRVIVRQAGDKNIQRMIPVSYTHLDVYKRQPYVVPMNYGYTMEEGKLTLYLHGATQGRKIEVMRNNPKVFFEMECDVLAFDGNAACQYGTSYASIMGEGRAEILEDTEEDVYKRQP